MCISKENYFYLTSKQTISFDWNPEDYNTFLIKLEIDMFYFNFHKIYWLIYKMPN